MAEPTLLLIHGLGATSGVWADVVASVDWPGKVVSPDLPGHGAGEWTGDYTVGALSAGIAAHCENGEEVVVVGHSLGGGVGVCLASNVFRPVVQGVVALGVKVSWSDADVEGMAGVAAKGVRWCETRDEAVQRFLRNSGLAGIVDPDHPAVEDAVAEGEGGWRVAQDPMTFAQRKLDMAGLLSAAKCPVILGAGEHDAMCPESDLAVFTDDARIAPNAGHNVMVEDPSWVRGLIEEISG
ncbi:MAG: alpha/beta hydrolase [Actinomycetota bacterium]